MRPPDPPPPALDTAASEHFTFRDFCTCSEAWRRTQVENVPQEAATYAAIRRLCEQILEPVLAEFGAPRLTYGFAGAKLIRQIRAGVAPALDQHAGYERRASGALICPRGGQAVDLSAPGVSAWSLADYIASALPFDRLYIYGDDRPIHVSVGPEMAGSIVHVDRSRLRPVPRRLDLAGLRARRP
ncbi:hypothetical protein [Phenylobacterium sp.]|uniref:hypothetical protein n=1 Tax=Phenylobacterium sp. TaxID=1871053 RepID=UPI002FE38D9C